MLVDGDLLAGHLTWNATSNAIPLLPPWEHGDEPAMLLLDEADILAHYPSTENFLRAWDGHDRFGDRLLVHRGLHCLTPRAFAEYTRESKWQLARDALPGGVAYARCRDRDLHSWERDWYAAGRHTLSHIATVDGRCEYSAFVGDKEHVRPREVFHIRQMVRRGADDDGNPVESVRIAFPNEAMARAEGRPLQDVGATVVYLDANAEDVVLSSS